MEHAARCNVLLILGAAALLRPVSAGAAAFRRDGSVLVGATLLCLWTVLSGDLGRLVGGFFVLLLIGFVIFTYFAERHSPAAAHLDESDAVGPGPKALVPAALMFIGGLALTVIGARLLVRGAIDLALALGVSETVVGLTVVAIGTSLPELVTSVVAAVRGQSEVAFGNIIGSNIFNILGILGVTALVQPLRAPPEIAGLDIWVMLAATAALLVVTVTGWRITRREGGLMLGGYVANLAYLVANV